MDLGIRGRVALVSGGSRGIGRAIAERFAEEGVRVVIAARTPGPIEEAVEAIEATGAEAAGVEADMTTEAGVARAVGFARERFGPPDIAIANVVSPADGDFFELDEARFIDAYRVLTLSIAHLARAVIPDMRARRWGRIVSVGSGSAKEPPRELRHVLGNTARSSGVTLVKSLANEFGRDGITVNSLGTGLFRTAFMEAYFERLGAERGIDRESAIEAWCETIPVRRPGEPREMAALCAYLCSELGGYVTGQLVMVDGGFGRSAW